MGTDKATLKIKSETLLERLIRILSPLFDGIIISTSPNAPLPPHTTQNSPNTIRYVIDERSDCGPLMAIYSCLKASPSNVNFVIACDIPEINTTLIQKLLLYSRKYEIIVPSFSEKFVEPLFAVYNRSILPIIQQQIAADRLKITDCFPFCNTRIVPITDFDWYRNLNTRDQFDTYTSQQRGAEK